MVKLRNINPLGHVDLPLIGREGDVDDQPGTGCLIPGEVFEVPADVAKRLLEQTGNYERVAAPKKRAPRKSTAKKAAAAPPAPVVE